MENARQELLLAISGESPLKCATIVFGKYYNGIFKDEDDEYKHISLKVDYTQEEYEFFLQGLDFNYDSGYGTQQLFGTLWHEDGSWQERGEYDGSEWWEHKQLPTIPEFLY